MRIVRTPSIDSVSWATIGCEGSSALRDESEGNDAQALVHLAGSVEPPVAKLKIAHAEAGQAERSQSAEDGDRIMLGFVDAFLRLGRLDQLDLLGRVGFDFQCAELDAHVIGDFLQLLEFLVALFQVDRYFLA
jgi:hypothetical protein